MLFPNFSTALLALAAFTSTTDAWPQKPQPQKGLSTLAKKMPKNDLQAPTDLELKYVVLGIGTQNYTCLEGESAAPGTTGATAKLYDIGTKLNVDPLAQYKIPTISGLALSLSAFGTWQMDMYLKVEGYNQWLGNHFFTVEKVPTFSLYRTKTTPHPLAMVKKVGEMAAPKTACPGLKGEGAVKWLYLPGVEGLSQGGVNTVYRLETAGGSAPATCKGQPQYFEVQYAAQYWMYGPKA